MKWWYILYEIHVIVCTVLDNLSASFYDKVLSRIQKYDLTKYMVLTINILSNAQSHFCLLDIVRVLLICFTKFGLTTVGVSSDSSSVPFSRSSPKPTFLLESFLSRTFVAGWALLTAWPRAEPMPPKRFLAAAPAAWAASFAAFISSSCLAAATSLAAW